MEITERVKMPSPTLPDGYDKQVPPDPLLHQNSSYQIPAPQGFSYRFFWNHRDHSFPMGNERMVPELGIFQEHYRNRVGSQKVVAKAEHCSRGLLLMAVRGPLMLHQNKRIPILTPDNID